MRLSAKEQNAIVQAFVVCMKDIPYELHLFGSRADDQKKGGDIDLLVVTSQEAKAKVVDKKTILRSKIFELIPEQRIDITVATEAEMTQDLFLRSVRAECIRLDNSL